ncbi:hypothetical protein [Paraferrimonas sedimenticola]|uniref:Uncharacterized protein n=1 Tax=Paraferrimonas sedimenticola TaxID=375674 RepID=A0AA37W1M6_9GAMM|nr:hypothetical protein [Paraferrimonas sedimenticola]GLP97003.1 hypothetical protein GCM10007895_23090 [Paraferrimonas sedimenticola]
MKVENIVRFNNELFFEGAVQLSWLEKRPEQAQKAAESFVFHGPKYHSANAAESEGIDGNYQLKDTSSFVNDLLSSLIKSQRGYDAVPYSLVVAGYGSGKSHLAVTCASILSAPQSDTSKKIITQISNADEAIGERIKEKLCELPKPVLVLPLDGMAGFHLGNALSKSIFNQFRALGVDAEHIRSLSPRFKTASQFVERNYSIRQDSFDKVFNDRDQDYICQKLEEHDEATYEAVDLIYSEANGQSIPIEGQESAQELIDTLCSVYCGDDGPFSNVVILFDEFGRYLEHAADKPHLAGDAALQQIFQGIQDNSDKIRFIGFIQYELKTYLKRFSGTGLRQLQRYITRFDAAEKYYLSTNLETIFAHMILKDERALEDTWLNTNAARQYEQSHTRLSLCLPSFSRFPMWENSSSFIEVIGRGCWPLHPLAVWFLTRQKDVVQSRSALTFIKETIARIAEQPAQNNGRIKQISTADLVLRSMLSELVAAERQVGGSVAETLQSLIEKFKGHLDESQQLVLASVAALEKMRIGKQEESIANAMICEASALDETAVNSSLEVLSELGALEWNRDLGQYELLTEGASRGQFQQWLRKLQHSFDSSETRRLFMRRATRETALASIETEFALMNQISTPDWVFEASSAHLDNLKNSIEQAFKEWSEAHLPTDPKGKAIYLYIDSGCDLETLEQRIREYFAKQLVKYGVAKAPIWVIGISDAQSTIMEHLVKLHIFEEQISEADKERYRRFIPDELRRCNDGLDASLKQALKERLYWVAGVEDLKEKRLKKVGTEVFGHIYTSPLAFPFDGFATKNNTAKADCAQLMRGLITRQVDGSWVQAQRKSLHNRVNNLLALAWGSLLSSGKVVPPRETLTKAVFTELVEEHKNEPQTTLKASYRKLIHPPYGMTSASAGVLISLLISLDLPPRRIEFDGELISSADWVNTVFKGKSNELQESVLARTKIRFLSENSETIWSGLLERWDSSEKYTELVSFKKDADSLDKSEPVPEHLEGMYRYLSDRSLNASSELTTQRANIDKYERSLEKAARTQSVSHSLSIASSLLKLSRQFEDSEVWPSEYLDECNELMRFAVTLFSDKLADWIPTQTCHSYANLSKYRRETESYISALKSLGYEKQAAILKGQMTSSIHRIEKLQKHKLTLDEAEDYPRQPKPSTSTPVRELRDEVSKGDELIEAIKAATDALTEAEIDAHVKAISARQELLRKEDAERRKSLGELYTIPSSEQGVREALLKAKHLRQVFLDTRDEQEISEIVFQLEYMINDFASWPVEGVSATRLAELLLNQSAQQAKAYLELLDEKDIEALWLENIYEIVASQRIESAFQQSHSWTNTRIIDSDKIASLPLSKCEELIEEFSSVPVFISEEDKSKIDDCLTQVSSRATNLKNALMRLKVKEWVESASKSIDIDRLTPHEAKGILAKLASPPFPLNAEEMQTIEAMESTLQSYLDQVSLDDILERINKLPIEKRKEILNTLERSFQNT